MTSLNTMAAADPPAREDALEDSDSLEWMDPFTIRYTQDTISPFFTRKILQRPKPGDSSLPSGSYSEALRAAPAQPLADTLRQLVNGVLKVDDIPVIRVCKHGDKVYSLDNRRLWVFREYGKPIPVTITKVDKEFFRKLTTEADGETIRIVDSREKRVEDLGKKSLESMVLEWAIEDVMNERMYINKVRRIPSTFPDFETYYKAFRWPLMEETRGHLQQSLAAIGSAPYISLKFVEETLESSSHTGQLRELRLITHVGRNYVSRETKGAPWKPKPTDLVVLSTLVPETLEDLQRSGEHYTFALIVSGGPSEESDTGSKSVENNDDSSVSFKVTAYLPTESPEYLEILEGEKSWCAVFMDNLVTKMRIWEALHPDRFLEEIKEEAMTDPEPWLTKERRELVEETLYKDSVLINEPREIADGTSNSKSQECTYFEGGNEVEDDLEAVIEKYCNFRRLNASQTQAVKSTTIGLLKQELCRVRLIQGPPGTGKTSTVIALLSIVSCLTGRVLVCAPTNKAVSEVAQRFLQMLQDGLATSSLFSDFTSPASIGVRFCRPLQVGDVVLVGNKDSLDTNGVLSNIFLPNRINRLLMTLSPLSGWRHTAQVVVDFLRNALTEYELYVKLWHSNKDKEETSLLDFLHFTRKKMNLLGPKMIENGHVMSNDLPSTMLSADERKLIEASCDMMGTLLELLASDCLKDEMLRLCFIGSCSSNYLTNGKVSILCNTKDKFLDLLSSRPGYVLREGGCRIYTAEWVGKQCLKQACLVFSTTSSAGRWSVRASGPFQYVVIDEAAQLVEAETAVVTQLPGIKHALLVGDPKQLQALVMSQIAKDSGYGRSLFERLQTLGHPCHILNVQYRMHPAISLFPNKQFYGGVVTDGHNVISKSYETPVQDIYGPYAFIDVKDGADAKDENGSWKNVVEAEVVHYLINQIQAGQSHTMDVGVIAPYKSQVDFLMKRVPHCCTAANSGPSTKRLTVDVKTVDGFQGGEKDVILFSAVRANSGGHIGFANDARRLNVALTRGRYCVWVVGNASTLAAHDQMWRALVEDAKRRSCYVDARNDPGLKKIILRANKQLEQFDSLLHHDSVMFMDTIWKVVFSKEFKDNIIKIKSTHSRQTILNTILNLANGLRSSYPTRCVAAAETYSKMIHVQPTAGRTLVWTIDVEKGDPIKQLIKIWDAVEPSHLQGLIRRLEAAFSTYTAAYIERCSTLKFESRMNKAVIPAVWKRDTSFVWHEASRAARKTVVAHSGDLKALDEHPLEKSNVEESILLMKFYSLTSGIARHLLTAVDGSEIELLFEVNEEEAAIINYPFSTFILGRSGTGKTTVITTKLLKLEQHFRLAVNGFLSRSVNGTGKEHVNTGEVTCSMEKKAIAQPVGTESLRQAMITLSPKLCAAIKHHIAKTRRTMLAADGALSGDGEDKGEDVMLDEEEELKLMGGIPDTLVNISPSVFPLVITFRKFLAMIDGSVACPFLVQASSLLDSAPTNESLSWQRDKEEPSGCQSGDEEETQGAGEGNEDEAEYFNPGDSDDDSYSEMSSLDGDLNAQEYGVCAGQSKTSNRVVAKTRTEVTFEVFNSYYWPKFNQKLIKGFDSSTVFTEIISFIKGSLKSLHTRNGRLSRQQYVLLAAGRTSNFDDRQRDAIYNIFLLYEKYKSVKGEYDISDYSMHLYQQMNLGNYMGLKFNYVYVDEVQDLTMAQIALFKYVCINVEEGYVFAGDTAQTIARGVSFRFQDIRHLFYTEFLGKGDNPQEKKQSMGKQPLICDQNHEPASSSVSNPHREKPPLVTGSLTSHMPDLHHLRHNFRTHVGIVKIANSIVQLLHHFFPNAVDKLDPESSLIQGDTPIFLEPQENHEFVTSVFGHGGAAGGGGCDFGAEQVILVRNAETRHAMIEKLGKRGLVMSVLECKGLEFQDVLLYNFFTDSRLESKWRVLYSYMAENSMLEVENGRQVSFPQFNLQKHSLLMSELKQLYVVVTRARQRLWIYDECPERHQPVLDFWTCSGLIQVKRLDEELIKTIHGKSTPEDWKRRGIQMFNDHHYDMAQLSFERAGDMFRANWAKAAGMQQAGERLLGSEKKNAALHFKEAATLFLSLEKGEAAAKCHIKIGDNRKAGFIFQESCKPPRFEEAGDCFMDAKCWEEAVKAYASCLSYKKCLGACLRGKFLDVGADFLFSWEQQRNGRNPEYADSVSRGAISSQATGQGQPPVVGARDDEFETMKIDYLKKCALHHHNQRNIDLMMKFVRRFPSSNSQKVFLKRRDYFDQLLEVEEAEGNFIRAAELAATKGDLKHAATLLVQGGRHELAVEKLVERARFDMLWSDRKPGWPLIATTESDSLLQRARDIVTSYPQGISSDLLQEIDLLRDPGRGLEHWNVLKDSTNIRLQLVAGRQAIDEVLIQSRTMPASNSLGALVPDILPIWDRWSEQLTLLIQSINRARRRRDTAEDEIFLECSQTYLGVLKQAQSHLYVVTDADIAWLQQSIEVKLLLNQGKRCQVASGPLLSLAEAFWEKHFLQAGLEVVKLLDCRGCTSNELYVENLWAANPETEHLPSRCELLCKIYSITDTLVDMANRNGLQCWDLKAMAQKYGNLIYEASFPSGFNKETLNDGRVFREKVDAIFDSIATNLMLRSSGNCKDLPAYASRLESWGRIQVLLPFLSKQWIRNYGPEIEKHMPKDPNWSKMWREAHFLYSNMSEQAGKQNTCFRWLGAIARCSLSLRDVYFCYRKSVSPLLFVQILERCVVMDLAVHAHLHSLVLPESLVVTHMTGIGNTGIFSCILNMDCSNACNTDYKNVHCLSRFILDLLNSSCYQVETWFKEANIDWRCHLSNLILRFVVTVLTACINVQDRQLWDITVRTLRTVFQNHSPLITGLPQVFLTDLEKVFTSPKYPQDEQVRAVFMRAMAAIKVPLIVLTPPGRKIVPWAYICKIRVMFITRNRNPGAPRIFRTDYSADGTLGMDKKSTAVLDGSQGKTTDSSILQWQETESSRSNETSHVNDAYALESVGPLLRTSPSVGSHDYLDDSQDDWVGDGSTDDPALVSQTIPPGHVSVGEGKTVALFVKERLVHHLDKARQRLKEELSAIDRYKRDCRTSFQKMNLQSKKYSEVFLSEVCAILKATADELLENLEGSVQFLKDKIEKEKGETNLEDEADALLDRIADLQENLHMAVDILDPRNEVHREEDLNRLEEKIADVKRLVESGKQLQSEVRHLMRKCENSNYAEEDTRNTGENGTPANQVQGGNRKKKKPQKKKKKGKR